MLSPSYPVRIDLKSLCIYPTNQSHVNPKYGMPLYYPVGWSQLRRLIVTKILRANNLLLCPLPGALKGIAYTSYGISTIKLWYYW